MRNAAWRRLFFSALTPVARFASDIDLFVVENIVHDRRKETIGLRRILSPLGIPDDSIVHRKHVFDEWCNAPGTLMCEVIEEGEIAL